MRGFVMDNIFIKLGNSNVALAVGYNFPSLPESLVLLSGNMPFADVVSGILFLFTLLLIVFLGLTAAVYYLQISKNSKPAVAVIEMFRRIYNILAIVAAFTTVDLAIFRGIDILMWVMLGFTTLLFLGYPSVNYRYVASALRGSLGVDTASKNAAHTLFTPRQFLIFFSSVLIAPLAILLIGDAKISFFLMFIVQAVLVYLSI
jgi:hypothetical protein